MFTMNVDTGGAAFDDPAAELARILRQTADKIERGDYYPGHSVTVLDVNGNDVGRWKIGADR